MRIALRLPDHQTTTGSEFNDYRALGEIAVAAEAAGFDAIFVSDHPAPGADLERLGEHHTFDPFVMLAYIAGITQHLRLLTASIVLPYRNPLLTAKAVATLDVVSGGRTILGVVPGYMREEFAALGVDFEERNELTDEALEVMRLAWSGEPFSFRGRHFTATHNLALLKPVVPPPIWVGGNSRRAIRRAVERADGWMPFPVSEARAVLDSTAPMDGDALLEKGITYARAHALAVGRTTPLEVIYMPLAQEALQQPDPERWLADAKRLADLGVTYFVIQLPMTSRATLLAAIAQFAGDMGLTGRDN